MKRKKGQKSPNATTEYLILKSKNIYMWLVSGHTFSDIAKRLGVSRSWLFEQFKSNPQLDELRKSALAERAEAVNNTLYNLAIGNYTTRTVHTKTVTTTESGTSKTVSTTTEDRFEHIADPNLAALGMLTRQMAATNARAEGTAEIDDTISEADVEKFTYVDVTKEPDSK